MTLLSSWGLLETSKLVAALRSSLGAGFGFGLDSHFAHRPELWCEPLPLELPLCGLLTLTAGTWSSYPGEIVCKHLSSTCLQLSNFRCLVSHLHSSMSSGAVEPQQNEGGWMPLDRDMLCELDRWSWIFLWAAASQWHGDLLWKLSLSLISLEHIT